MSKGTKATRFAEPREEVEPLGHPFLHGIEAELARLVEERTALEDGHGSDVERRPGGLGVQERGVECRHALDGCRGRWGRWSFHRQLRAWLGERQDLGEGLDEAGHEQAIVRHGRGVGHDAEAGGVDVGEQRHVQPGAGRRCEGVLPEQLGAGQVRGVGEPGDVGGDGVDVLEHAAHDAAGQAAREVGQHGRDQVAVLDERLLLPRPGDLAQGPDPLGRVGDGAGHLEADRDEPVAREAVGARSHADRHGDAQRLDRAPAALVVAGETADHAGEEGVVQRAAGGVGRVAEPGEREVDRSRVAGSCPGSPGWARRTRGTGSTALAIERAKEAAWRIEPMRVGGRAAGRRSAPRPTRPRPT